MTDDCELLRRYAHESSEEAFAELVRRHLGLVYHAALRQCGGDSHRAEDVAQTVFSGLARKAAQLSASPALAGWLHTSTRYAAAQAVRGEVRRQHRERAAHALTQADEPATPAAVWERLKPDLDAALHSLGAADREAVLLRYFEQLTYREIGARVALTEDAVRMRIERALEQLRRALSRRGVSSTAAALGAALEAHATAAAPAALAAGLTTGALAPGAAGAAAAATLFMSITKLQFAAVLGAFAVASAGLVWQHHTNVRQAREIAGLRLAVAADRAPPPANVVSATPPAGGRFPATTGPAAAPPPRVAVTAPGGGARLAEGLSPVEALGNTGRATPRTAWATQLWAARTGDVALEASALQLTPDERAKLQDLIGTLPPELRAQYGTPEEILAYALAGSPHPVGGMQVLGETDQGPNDVTLQTQWQHVDDTIVHRSSIQFHQDGDGWKMVVPASIVTRAVAYLGRL